MDRERLAEWLGRYVEAWTSGDAKLIGELFAQGAEYRYHPYDDPVRGREAIVKDWLSDPDPPGSFEARYEPLAVDGDLAFAAGKTTYFGAQGVVDRLYDNLFVMRFDDDGRCLEFTEWFMKRPEDGI